jgi:glycosyltransferase involved in cell wall biosynthesis
MKSPLVSIIIPTYNRAYLIHETLDSVLAQTYTNWECIVVDDGSTDNTEEVLKTYLDKDSRFQYYKRPNSKLKGANTCRNYGFGLSKGKYVNWFDDDDVMLQNFLKMKIDALQSGVDLIICSGYYVDYLLQNKVKMNLENEFDLFKDFVLWKLHIITNSILFRKSFLEKKKLFSNKISRGQETELFSRLFFKLAKESYQIVNLPLFLYRQHEDTKTTKNFNYIKKYRESISYITIENLKRGIELKDIDLIHNNYKNLIDSFFRGIDNSHFKNSNNILINLVLILFKKNILLVIELLFFFPFLLLISRGSYRIEQHFKKYEINY